MWGRHWILFGCVCLCVCEGWKGVWGGPGWAAVHPQRAKQGEFLCWPLDCWRGAAEVRELAGILLRRMVPELHPSQGWTLTYGQT